jgi:hypothetical protein
MFELVAVNRLNAKEQTRIRFYNELEEAEEEAERRRKSEPLTVFYVYIWVSSFCRLVCHHTL